MEADNSKGNSFWLCGGLHPTLRRVREGWGTRRKPKFLLGKLRVGSGWPQGESFFRVMGLFFWGNSVLNAHFINETLTNCLIMERLSW